MTKQSATSTLKLEDFREEHPLVETASMYLKNYSAVMGLIVLSLIIVISLIGPFIYSTDPFEMVWAPFTKPGEQGFILGTDYLGRDLLAQIIHGGRVTLAVGCAAALLSLSLIHI